MKTGAPGGILDILTQDAMLRIHHAALDLLQDPGIQSESDLFLDIFARGGAQVDRERAPIRRAAATWSRRRSRPSRAPSCCMAATTPPWTCCWSRAASTTAWAAPPSRCSGTTTPWQSRQPTKQDMIASTRHRPRPAQHRLRADAVHVGRPADRRDLLPRFRRHLPQHHQADRDQHPRAAVHPARCWR